MAKKFKIRKGDRVIVVTGRERGKTGEVLQVLRQNDRVLVQGVNMIKRHMRCAINPAVGDERFLHLKRTQSPCNVAVVGVRSESRGTERAILVAETTMKAERHQELLARISGALKARLLEVDEIRLVPPHSLPRTTSGKLRRRALAGMLQQPGG